MESRYYNLETKKTHDGRTVYRPKIYPNIPLRDDDVYVMTELGDRLDTLAFQYYEDPTLWWIIATANNINDATFYVEPGVQLRIPSDTNTILNDLQKINR
jgi:hypothetical protein